MEYTTIKLKDCDLSLLSQAASIADKKSSQPKDRKIIRPGQEPLLSLRQRRLLSDKEKPS